MLFEDAHWADATSLELLDLAIERVRRLPVLLLITYRPEFASPWKDFPDVATLVLHRLDHFQVETPVECMTAGRRLPTEVMAQIVAKTDGVPSFVEELTKNGLLIEDGDRYRLDGPLPPLAIPSTLQDSLMARLDRLATVKEVAQIGAAVGREFRYGLLRDVAGRDDASLQNVLAQLEDSELVFRSGEPPQARYTFKHALVQDAAYESLLESRRQILHRHMPKPFATTGTPGASLFASGSDGARNRILGQGRQYRPAAIGIQGSDLPPGRGDRDCRDVCGCCDDRGRKAEAANRPRQRVDLRARLWRARDDSGVRPRRNPLLPTRTRRGDSL